jgi:hypothetical protein
MHAFDERECDLLAKALDRAYLVFLAAGRLNEKNLDIAQSMLSRAVIQCFQRGERDEFKLANYAQKVFSDFIDEVSERDLAHLKGTSADSRTDASGQQIAITHG